MSLFGKRDGGGRRSAGRSATLLPARLTTTTTSYPAYLLDVSASGARVRGIGLPANGEELVFAAERTQAFARICWSDGEERGLLFEERLSPEQLGLLQAEAQSAKLMGLSPDQKLAMQDWEQGMSR